MDKNKISLKRSLSPAEAAGYLEEFARGMRTGTVVVTQGEETLCLTMPKMIQAVVSAKVKKEIQKFSLELEWEAESDEEIVISGARTKPGQAEACGAARADAAAVEVKAPGPVAVKEANPVAVKAPGPVAAKANRPAPAKGKAGAAAKKK